SSRASTSSLCRSVSTTSMASMSSSRRAFSFTATSFIAALAAPLDAQVSRSARLGGQLEGLAALDEPCEPLLARLDGVANLGRVLRGKVAHLGDDLARADLVAHDR